MLVELSWDNKEKSILRYTFKKGWGWDDIGKAMQDASLMVSSVPHRVDVLMDFSESGLLPDGALGYTGKYFKNKKPDNLKLTVIVGTSIFLKGMFDLASKIWRSDASVWRLEFVRSELDAYHVIEKDCKQEVNEA